jgi:squalene cyclase
MARALAYLRREQEADGSWFGRWGTNYIYGTWSVLCALNAAGCRTMIPAMRRAVDWLLRSSATTAAGARTRKATATPRAAATRRARRARPPGRCSA